MMDVSRIPVWRDYGVTPKPALENGAAEQVETAIVGSGPVGLSMALDLAKRGRQVVLLTALPFIASGSKAICFSKRSLEIYDRLGIGERLLEKGVVWERGKVFWKADEDPIYEFDLLPIKNQKFPAFINIQQYYVEEYLTDELEKYENVEIRRGHEVKGVDQDSDGVAVHIETADGGYQIAARYLIACDGSKSTIRNSLGLDFEGRVFEDNFLIADVKFKQEWPTERWFRFDPPYPGWSSLIHKQPDGVWRLDFQLGWDIDRAEAIKPENVEPFVRGILGPDIEFEYEWLSIYTFQCRRMARFLHSRVIFVGDSAHLVSPFGARGCNGGMQDVDNLGWKLDLVLDGLAPTSLLESYDSEATTIADENILNSTRSTDFLTPKTPAAQNFRDAVLELAKDYEFARPFVNSGRLSTAVRLPESSLNYHSNHSPVSGPRVGDPCIDAPVSTVNGDDWLLSHLGGKFALLVFSKDHEQLMSVREALPENIDIVQVVRSGPPSANRIVDTEGLAYERYGASDGGAYLVRPDQYIAARWQKPDLEAVCAAYQTAIGNGD